LPFLVSAPSEVFQLRPPVRRDFFFFAFRPLFDFFFFGSKLREGFIANVIVDPLAKLNGITPKILMTGEAMRRSVSRVKPGGLVPS
jgi:hypothetical protein